jgi:hypothetical protein
MEGLERSGISDGEVKEEVDSRKFKVESEEEENTSHRWSRDLADLGRSSAAPVVGWLISLFRMRRFDGSSESVVRRVEIIVGGVGGFCLGVAMGVVAAGLRRLAAFRMQSLNESDLREGAITGMTGRG